MFNTEVKWHQDAPAHARHRFQAWTSIAAASEAPFICVHGDVDCCCFCGVKTEAKTTNGQSNFVVVFLYRPHCYHSWSNARFICFFSLWSGHLPSAFCSLITTPCILSLCAKPSRHLSADGGFSPTVESIRRVDEEGWKNGGNGQKGEVT